MKIIKEANSIIPKQEIKDTKYRWSKYCIRQTNENNDYIVRNFINDAYIVINKSEFKEQREYLIQNYFWIPEESNETKLAKKVRKNVTKKPVPSFKTINSYTIMTTMDCNARCYYCYECGRTKNKMSEQTALDAAKFIIKKYNGRSVGLSWFGGEPLYNESVIDTIIKELSENNINYKSSMISNGYLFDASKIDKYKNEWKLHRVQITLDGVDEVYNKIKNFIYEDDAFSKVMDNIDLLTSNGIKVTIRLNLSSINKEDLIATIHRCKERFGKRKTFSMYVHNIFDEETSTDEEFLQALYKDLQDVESELLKAGYGRSTSIIKPILKRSACMANSGNSVVITPTGKLTTCEHHSEDEIIGDLYTNVYNSYTLKEWDERYEVEGLCEDCPLYPSCYMLKKCSSAICSKYKAEVTIKKIKLLMRNELKKQLQS